MFSKTIIQIRFSKDHKNVFSFISIVKIKLEFSKSDHQLSDDNKQPEDVEDKPADKPADKLRSNQCEICERTFSRLTHLKRHMTIHTDERAFACQLCDKKFRRADHLKNHENYHAKLKPHMCKHCKKNFSRAEHLRRHIDCRHTEKLMIFKCADCDFVAGSTKQLANHRKSHVLLVFACKFCNQPCPTRHELKEHLKSHNDVRRPFLCSECGMRFIRNDYLVIHMRRHKGEKPFQCKYCDRAFPRTTDLTVHERYHTNEKKHVNMKSILVPMTGLTEMFL